MVHVQDQIQRQTALPVLPDNTRKPQAIVGISSMWNTSLGLITRVCDITKDPDITDEPLIAEYEDVFQGLVCLQGEIKITVDPDVTPVQHACCKVPFRLWDQVKHDLDRMEQLGVIDKVEEPSHWVSSMVIVKKKSGDLGSYAQNKLDQV